MLINTFKPIKYRDCPIYIRQFAVGRCDEFEYSTIINGQLYTFQVSFRLRGIRALLAKLTRQPFSTQELENAVGYMEKAAQATIDTVLGGFEKKDTAEAILSPLQIKR